MAFELWSIIRSEQPRLRAIRALGVGLPLLLVIFAATYCTIAAQQTGAFSEPLNRTDGLYFTVTVFSTVGLGDIAPVTELARVLVTIQMLVGVLVVGLIAKLVLGAVQLAVVRRGRMPDHTGENQRANTDAPPSPCVHLGQLHPDRMTRLPLRSGTVGRIRARGPARTLRGAAT